MRAAAAVALALLPAADGRRVARNAWKGGERVLSPLPSFAAADLPKDFSWSSVNGTNFLTMLRNQHIPQYCGSCWAFGTTSALSDRLSILRGDRFPEINLSPQVVINYAKCGDCGGGDPSCVMTFAADAGIPDETCQNYEAVNRKYDAIGQCETCAPDKGCSGITSYTRYKVSEYGAVRGADKMKAEIMARGPIGCGVEATAKFEDYTGGVYSEHLPNPSLNHEISVVGWGVEEGTGLEYWVGRNSWGTYWGEEGFFRIQMHENNLGIETDCVWGVPVVPKPAKAAAGVSYFSRELRQAEWRAATPERTRPGAYTAPETGPLPSAYDIRSVNGKSYASPNRNQHIPQYCGSCWAHATTSSLNDRVRLQNGNAFPELVLSPEMLMACSFNNDTVNGCHGGLPIDAMAWVAANNITDETCSNYQAKDLKCTPENVCKTCSPGGGCKAVTPARVVTVTEHGRPGVGGAGAANVQDMMKEIFARGPIVCEMCVTPAFEAYTGGVFQDPTNCTRRDHDITLNGWGTDEQTGLAYWIGRNSWGTYWGEGGWFRLQQAVNTLGVENYCTYGVPKVVQA
eukprot:TRINITY_DN154_c0_g1_i1.p1 TRINITY_DN154_c0_g1~~TRINITY_DN154_c0_g1_i1.p1  ORF type:complete len:571 (+),score=218.32 TRINITY_DN154_c0_g1_i1:64-1776(+)